MAFKENFMRRIFPAMIVSILAAYSSVSHSSTPFEGTWVPDESRSTMLPGQTIPKDMVGTVKDDGSMLRTTQTFTTDSGRKMQYIWNAVCDGKPSVVEGANPPGAVTLSCIRTPEGIVHELKAPGYGHIETCSVSSDGQLKICKGTASLPDGSRHDFVYAFIRK